MSTREVLRSTLRRINNGVIAIKTQGKQLAQTLRYREEKRSILPPLNLYTPSSFLTVLRANAIGM